MPACLLCQFNKHPSTLQILHPSINAELLHFCLFTCFSIFFFNCFSSLSPAAISSCSAISSPFASAAFFLTLLLLLLICSRCFFFFCCSSFFFFVVFLMLFLPLQLIHFLLFHLLLLLSLLILLLLPLFLLTFPLLFFLSLLFRRCLVLLLFLRLLLRIMDGSYRFTISCSSSPDFSPSKLN